MAITDHNRIRALEIEVRRLVQRQAPRQIGEGLVDTGGGSGDDVSTNAMIFDQFDATTAYQGEATPGTATSSALWRVKKLVFGADGDVAITWADGDAQFNNIWDNRTALAYS